jgi:excisionase family DNA binding protein
VDTEADDELLDVKAAARYLGVRPAMVYRLVNEGRLTARRFPLRVRVRDLESCLERSRRSLQTRGGARIGSSDDGAVQ